MEHKAIPAGQRHAPHQWAFADATARAALSGAVAEDVDKIALQRDDGSYWRLTNHSPVTWASASGAAGTAYTHDQTIALSVWTVPHNLGRYPSVVVTDTLGQLIVPDVAYIDNNTVQITHGTPLAGFAYCN